MTNNLYPYTINEFDVKFLCNKAKDVVARKSILFETKSKGYQFAVPNPLVRAKPNSMTLEKISNFDLF
jgi:hypothetical protein